MDLPKPKVIQLGSKDEFKKIFAEVLASKVALSPVDKKDLDWFVRQYKAGILEFLPDKLENKENIAFLLATCKTNGVVSDAVVKKYFKTATDVLRLMVALSPDGDVSLATPTKLRAFKRSERKFFLEILEAKGELTEDMLRYKERWIRAGEILHPGDYAGRYPKTYKAFTAIRNNHIVHTFAGKFETAIRDKDLQGIIKLASTRPGEYARRLDWMLRTFPKGLTAILEGFHKVAVNVSSQVLLQLVAHYRARPEQTIRAFMPKGSIAKMQVVPFNLKPLSLTTCRKAKLACEAALISKFSTLDALGTVYVDPVLKDFPIPFALRSASKSTNVLPRGSKVALGEGDAVRMFIYWEQNAKTRRVDIDLSASFYNEDWTKTEHVSWTRLRSQGIQSYHSGDIVSAGTKGASEFIDVNIEGALKGGMRYLLMQVYSFTGQPYETLPKCYAGAMIRSKVQSGEIYDPRTVTHKFDLTADATTMVPIMFDLQERKVIWSDMTLTNRAMYRAVETSRKGVAALGMALTALPKPHLHDLFTLHGIARGTAAIDIENADHIFAVDKGITPYDIETITSEYL